MTEFAGQIAQWLSQSRRAAVFTGAGISTESGIPDFRSPGGVWSRTQPVLFDDFVNSADARLEYWRQKAEIHPGMYGAEPNTAHRVLAQWERAGRIRGIITQNIDGLHQLAGNEQVLELHGTARFVACLDCEYRDDADRRVKEFLAGEQVPDCPACGGLLKHATISFGQSLPAAVLQTAAQRAGEADLMFALGSSLVVEPAASIPRLTVHHGGRLVIINREPTPLDGLAACVVRVPLGEALEAIDCALRELTE